MTMETAALMRAALSGARTTGTTVWRTHHWRPTQRPTRALAFRRAPRHRRPRQAPEGGGAGSTPAAAGELEAHAGWACPRTV